MPDKTLPLSHFEAFYARGADPWHFASSAYEAAKYSATLAALPRQHYPKVLEIGCSIGVFTERMAERSGDLLAVEPVADALAAARTRNAGKPWVRFAPLFIPADWPDETFDLIIVSEVLDYLGADDLRLLARRLRASLRTDGELMLVHWVGKKGATAAPSESSEQLLAATADCLRPIHQTRNADYRLDLLRRI